MSDPLWPFKVGLLTFGFGYPTLGLILLLFDGRFHLLSSIDELQEQSPDWIIARHLFDRRGFNECNHKIIAILLISLATLSILMKFTNQTDKIIYPLTVQFIMPITLFIIIMGIITKNLILYKNSKSENWDTTDLDINIGVDEYPDFDHNDDYFTDIEQTLMYLDRDSSDYYYMKKKVPINN